MKKKIAFFASILGIIVFVSAAQAVGEVAHWSFDEGSGTLAEDSISTNDGTIYEDAAWTTDSVDGGYALDINGWGSSYAGTGGYVRVPNSPVLNPSSFTANAWVKIDTYDYQTFGFVNKHKAYSNPNSWTLRTAWQGPGAIYKKLDFELWTSTNSWLSVQSSSDYQIGVWQMITATYDDTTRTAKIYINGHDETVVKSSATSGSYLGNNLDLGIGFLEYHYASSLPWYRMPGIVDEVTLYSRVLSAEEISDLYESALDEDNDGVTNSDDMCLGSEPDNISLNPNQYAQNTDFGWFEVGPNNDQSVVYDMSATYGCTCTQIVEQLGAGNGHLKKGCSPSLMEEWTGLSANPDRQAGIGKKK